MAASSARSKEPHTEDGREYWREPGERKTLAPSVVGKVIGSVLGKKPTGAEAEAPLQLLMKRVPIVDIISRHGYGLDHMLRDGIDIDDFLANGYKWNDLCAFEYISQEGPLRCLETLTLGLGLTANHLRTYRDRLPIADIRKQTELVSSDFCKRLGLQFPPNGPLNCHGDTDWNAVDCVRLGLTMDDLIDFGLHRVIQYRDLMQGLTRSEAKLAEQQLGVTPEHMAMLVEEPASPSPPPEEALEDELEEELYNEAPLKPLPEEEEEEEEEEEVVESPIRREEPPIAPKRVARTQRAPPRKPMAPVAQARAKARFDMHGFVSAKKK